MKTRSCWAACWAACWLLSCGHSDVETLGDSAAPNLTADASQADASLLDASTTLPADAMAPQDALVVLDASGSEAGLPSFTRILECDADNAAKLSQSEVDALRAAAPGLARPWLYPAEGTVFPRGLRAPLLMWTSTEAARAVYVSIKSEHFEYEGCLVPQAKGRVALPEEVWRKAGEQGFGKGDPFQVELRELTAQGSVGGAAHTRFIIAPGSLKGSIYYNSYASRLAAKQGAPGGAILRVRAGQDAEVFLGRRACVGCHAVSANGTRLVTSNLNNPNDEGVYRLTPSTPINPPSLRSALDFVGLYPDGSIYATGTSSYTAEVLPGLYETDTGAMIANSQYPVEGLHPMFAPSGSLLTYTAFSGDSPDGITRQRLFVMDYDASKRRLANARSVVDHEALQSVDWPSFLPDNRAIVYADIGRNRLLLVDLATKQSIVLWHAMSFASDPGLGTAPSFDNPPIDPPPFEPPTYQDAYYPTVAPVAVGGYYWVFFDSYRAYGNVDTRQLPQIVPDVPPVLPPVDPDSDLPDWLRDLLGLGPKPAPNPGPDPAPVPPGPEPEPTAEPSRQLWGTAIEIAADGSYRADPSSPAFYLDGQEIGTNNHRAFAALDPCTARAGSCQSGIDCCDGFCEKGMCVAPPPRCAKVEEACRTHADCCDTKNLCINGFCSVVIPILQ